MAKFEFSRSNGPNVCQLGISPFQKSSKFPLNIKISLKLGSLLGKTIHNFVYSLLILHNQSHAIVLYVSNYHATDFLGGVVTTNLLGEFKLLHFNDGVLT
jgi:hypothetical protein